MHPIAEVLDGSSPRLSWAATGYDEVARAAGCGRAAAAVSAGGGLLARLLERAPGKATVPRAT